MNSLEVKIYRGAVLLPLLVGFQAQGMSFDQEKLNLHERLDQFMSEGMDLPPSSEEKGVISDLGGDGKIRPFAFGLDSKTWAKTCKKFEDDLGFHPVLEAKSREQLILNVNRMLEQFKLSHFSLSYGLEQKEESKKTIDPRSKLTHFSSSENRPTLAVLKIPTFSSIGYRKETIETFINKIIENKASGVVLDLRGNPGGDQENLAHLSQLLFPRLIPGVYLGEERYQRWSRFTRNYQPSRMSNLFLAPESGAPSGRFPFSSPSGFGRIFDWFRSETVRESARINLAGARTVGDKTVIEDYFSFMEFSTLPIVGLIDQDTESTAEIIALSLRNLRKAKIFGVRSAGAVLGSMILSLGEGYRLQFPIREWISSRGERLEGQGVIPDNLPEPESLTSDSDSILKMGVNQLFKELGAEPLSPRR